MATIADGAPSSLHLNAPAFSVVGSAIVAAGFLYPSLFVVVSRGCFPRICHQIVLQYDVLSGAQVMALRSHPIAPPYLWFIQYPPGWISLVPLLVGGVALAFSAIGLLRRAPIWLLIVQLVIAAFGGLFLLYDSFLWWRVTMGQFNGGPATTTISPFAIVGHALLYLGYGLFIYGVVRQMRQPKTMSLT